MSYKGCNLPQFPPKCQSQEGLQLYMVFTVYDFIQLGDRWQVM